MPDDRLMTRDEFNAKVSAWSLKVQQESLAILVAETKSYSGNLRSKLRNLVGYAADSGEAQTISFKFMRYGVFVDYGVGRGYTVQGGVVVRGKKIQANSVAAVLLNSRGYSKKELQHFTPRSGDINRHAVNWLDINIKNDIDNLADIAGEYFGDKSMQHVISQLNKITIKK